MSKGWLCEEMKKSTMSHDIRATLLTTQQAGHNLPILYCESQGRYTASLLANYTAKTSHWWAPGVTRLGAPHVCRPVLMSECCRSG